MTKEREAFIENLSMLVASGMTLSDALRAGAAELRSKRMRRIVGSVIEEVENGSSLWKALAGTGAFALHMVSLVRLGEESGKLAQNLKVIAVQQEKDRVFRSRIMSAMMYPVFVLALTVVVGTGIAWFILPRLAEVFSRLRIELPIMTRVLIAAGSFLGHYGVFAIPAAAAVILAVLAVMFWIPRTRFIGQALLFLLPGVRRLVQEVELARFGYLLGTLLEAGLGVTQALDSLAATTSFRVYGRLYARLRDLVEEGNSFQKSFALQKRLALLIPLSVQQLVVAGEQSGTLAQTLQKVHLAYEARIDMTTKNLTVILEPILLVIVWVGVVFVALAIILPIYSLIGGLNQPSGTPTQTPPPVSQIQFQDEEAPFGQPAAPAGFEARAGMLEIIDIGRSRIFVRAQPSPDGTVVGSAGSGERFPLEGETDGWWSIVLSGGVKGWVWGEYVTILDENE